ncbi:homoserine dehydrogenase [Schwartzia succinivorans]|jgi:homoserine dehydrogenase|uniref:Homoserine dehydrogenase n=1 Tax=Schwartzia succinivorans DSM 10502 TaxID=1123243 RepID=A0A1M4VZW2_9FIRM|nr:homoserine dehydrogenase [Schwartzia succinivorans]SHE74499.1 homoserine dehydrogenase [Schwartzia succinivorans DSM 10502]
MGKTIKIGLLGSGTVGSGVVEVLKKNVDEISQKSGTEIEIKKILVRDLKKKRPHLEGMELTDDINDILKDEDIDIIVELMGGLHPAREYMLRAMKAGKHVVTANKDVVAQFGKDMFGAAKENRVEFLFEASVGGGIPIITPLKESLTANRITEVMGIVNGTTNYMLTQMTNCGNDYETALREAQELGYAEANPAADVEGYDAARKVAILASLAFNTRVTLDDVSVEGITHITPQDIEYAKELGYVIKLLAIANDSEKGVDVRVHPAFLKKAHPLASVNDVFNAIFIKGNAIGEAMFYGQGAGSLPTASAVVADIITVAREIVKGIYAAVDCSAFQVKPFCPLEETESSYYIRLLVADQPGVLGTIATVFGDQGVSLKSVIQTQRVKDQAEIVVVTHHVYHKQLLKAEQVLLNLPVVTTISNVIRVETKKGEV